MRPPTAKQQLEFLTNIQRLLSEGQFVATYKYALLLALADLAVECGDDSGDALVLPTRRISEKYIQYYWRQCMPYVPRGRSKATGQVLMQNTGQQAAIVNRVAEARSSDSDSLTALRHDTRGWKQLVTKVNSVVRKMPLWKLQTVGRTQLTFLYENSGDPDTIELQPGVAYCFRHFHALIGDLVRGAWVRYIRRHNHDLLGTTTDLNEFLFGSERTNLAVFQPILQDLQRSKCFYCEKTLQRGSEHVDHFVPWSKYPVDLGHNFVLAHDRCNSAKADHLAAAEYLAKWAERNGLFGEQLEAEFDRQQVLHDLPTSAKVTHWAYRTAYQANGHTWVRSKDLVVLAPGWDRPLLELLVADPGDK